MTIGLVQHGGHAMRAPPRECDTRRVSTSADHCSGLLRRGQRADRAPRTHGTHDGLPVLPRLLSVQRVQVEQRVRELGPRQHVFLDAAPGADEMRLHGGIELHECACDGQSRIEMSTRAAASEEDACAHAVGAIRGSVADTPYTRSRSLPMFTRMPVCASVSSKLERP